MMPELVPSQYYLGQNYPNPFRGATTIKYCIPRSSRVVITIHDTNGRIVMKLVDEEQPGGTHVVCWNAAHMPAGTYQYRMNSDGFECTREMKLVR